MIKKSYSKTGAKCRVTFRITAESANNILILGDFNNWKSIDGEMTQRKDGYFSKTLSLASGKEYNFRYLVTHDDHQEWKNDDEADLIVPNVFGTENAVLSI